MKNSPAGRLSKPFYFTQAMMHKLHIVLSNECDCILASSCGTVPLALCYATAHRCQCIFIVLAPPLHYMCQ